MFFGKRFSGYHRFSLSGLDILVLSIIKNNDGISGYEIIQKINKKFKDLWKASAGTIYPLLNRLAEKKYVKTEKIIENNRQKKIYKITEIGNQGLKKVLENNLQPSINTLGDYIKTIFKASILSEETIEKMMCCFPFPDFPFEEEINLSDLSSKNIERLKRIIQHLKRGKLRLEKRINKINEKIEKYTEFLKEIEIKRYKNAKPIEIVDNDEEFDNF
ncbi:MAG: PadR family transcriptional regulator [Promethearchaeota archaeon]